MIDYFNNLSHFIGENRSLALSAKKNVRTFSESALDTKPLKEQAEWKLSLQVLDNDSQRVTFVCSKPASNNVSESSSKFVLKRSVPVPKTPNLGSGSNQKSRKDNVSGRALPPLFSMPSRFGSKDASHLKGFEKNDDDSSSHRLNESNTTVLESKEENRFGTSSFRRADSSVVSMDSRNASETHQERDRLPFEGRNSCENEENFVPIKDSIPIKSRQSASARFSSYTYPSSSKTARKANATKSHHKSAEYLMDQKNPIKLPSAPSSASVIRKSFSSAGWATNTSIHYRDYESPQTTSQSSGEPHRHPHQMKNTAETSDVNPQQKERSFCLVTTRNSTSSPPSHEIPRILREIIKNDSELSSGGKLPKVFSYIVEDLISTGSILMLRTTYHGINEILRASPESETLVKNDVLSRIFELLPSDQDISKKMRLRSFLHSVPSDAIPVEIPVRKSDEKEAVLQFFDAFSKNLAMHAPKESKKSHDFRPAISQINEGSRLFEEKFTIEELSELTTFFINSLLSDKKLERDTVTGNEPQFRAILGGCFLDMYLRVSVIKNSSEGINLEKIHSLYKNLAENFTSDNPVNKWILDCFISVFKKHDIPIGKNKGDSLHLWFPNKDFENPLPQPAGWVTPKLMNIPGLNKKAPRASSSSRNSTIFVSNIAFRKNRRKNKEEKKQEKSTLSGCFKFGKAFSNTKKYVDEMSVFALCFGAAKKCSSQKARGAFDISRDEDPVSNSHRT